MATATEVQEHKVDELKTALPAKPRRPSPIREPFPAPRPMFADSLLDTTGSEKARRGFSTVFSFILQCAFIGVLLILPLMFTEALPTQQLLTFLVAPPPPPPPPPAAAEAVAKIVRQIQSDLLSSGQLRTPSRIPQKVQMIKEEEAPPPMPVTGGVIGGVPGGVPGGQLGGVIGGIVNQTSGLTIVPKFAVPAKPIRVSQGVTSGLLIRRVEPRYPFIAQQAHIEGQVILTAIISKTGDIENLTLMSGHPMLVPSAIEAVRQWHYRPYLLNGEPVEVETIVTVTFVLR